MDQLWANSKRYKGFLHQAASWFSTPAGNLYGATTYGGLGRGGTVFELSPTGSGWGFSTLYTFSGSERPRENLTRNAAGNLYGTTFGDGAYGLGCAFKLSPSDGGWIYTDLHDFSGGDDGANPISTLIPDAGGNLYGTASAGGSNNLGVIFQTAP